FADQLIELPVGVQAEMRRFVHHRFETVIPGANDHESQWVKPVADVYADQNAQQDDQPVDADGEQGAPGFKPAQFPDDTRFNPGYFILPGVGVVDVAVSVCHRLAIMTASWWLQSNQFYLHRIHALRLCRRVLRPLLKQKCDDGRHDSRSEE